MSQYILDCSSNTNCTLTPYTVPPATVDHYAMGPEWVYFVAGVVILAFIVAVAVVRYKAHQERGDTDRERILNPPRQCPTCGDKLVMP